MKSIACLILSLAALTAGASELRDDALKQIRFDQVIGAQAPLEARFCDETGKAVRLGDYFGRKPVILVMGYYQCPMLCHIVANGLVETLHDLKADAGKEFDVLDVSISPAEKPEMAAAARRETLRHYGRTGTESGWHFLTGDEASIRQLAQAVGFRYAYDSTIKQYAHPSGFIVLTPQGRVSRYFFGVDFRARELSDALHEASANHTGSPIRQLLLLCFHYSPITSKYGALILDTVRAIGVGTLLALGVFVARSIRSEPKARS
jgi:protein SCO1/2